VLHGKVYAVGGWDGSQYLPTCETFTPKAWGSPPTAVPGLTGIPIHVCTATTRLGPPHHIRTGTLASCPRHLCRDWAHPCPHLHLDWAHPRPRLRRDRTRRTSCVFSSY
jgi:hypothetical protein